MSTTQRLDFSSYSQDALQNLLDTYKLNLTIEEALTIQHSFLKRPPTLAECVLWSIQGSEHCSYKSTRQYLKQFNTTSPQVILGAKEDAGIVSIATDHAGLRYGLVVSHESHNHPSQIVPYEGAATGVGGNVRDVCCMGAEVIAVADSLRFGALLEAHTHWIHQGVVNGIAGYGNPLGIPNIAGDVYYDAGYNENCLVTVVTLGIVPENCIIHSYAPEKAEDYVFILVGKPTDNSGFGGASFASQNLAVEKQEQNKGAVQEPNAFLQRHLLKANYALFDILREKNLLHRVGFKDLGAGGIACSSVELAETSGLGAEINLDDVPVEMADLMPEVILCSETQERFMWVVSPDLAPLILKHYNEKFALGEVSVGAAAKIIGKIRSDGRYVVTYQGETIVDAQASDITKGLRYDRPYELPTTKNTEPTIHSKDLQADFLKILAHENIASRAAIFEKYDKQVQGRTIIEAGCADAGVIQPFNEEKYPLEIRQIGVALSLDHNPRYNKIDAYWGAVNAVAESVRNIIAVGATPVAITDCLCFGNPEKAAQMGEFVAAVQGIKEACAAIKLYDHPEATLPVIAGNVSLYNTTQTASIPPSPMISCIGVLKDVAQAVTFDFKQSDSFIVMIGLRADELGGSVFYQLYDELGAQLPRPDLQLLHQECIAVHTAITAGWVLAAHDIAEGGVAIAIAEMSFKNKIGCKVEIHSELNLQQVLFSETGGFLLEIPADKIKLFKETFAAAHFKWQIIGKTMLAPRIQINDDINLSISDAYHAWENGLREKLL